MSKLISTPLKFKITSFILGVIGAMWFVSCVLSSLDLTAHEILFRIGAGLSSVSLALEPAFLFGTVSVGPNAFRTLPKLSTSMVILTVCSLLCFLLSGLIWLVT